MRWSTRITFTQARTYAQPEQCHQANNYLVHKIRAHPIGHSFLNLSYLPTQMESD
jgi:hypothetical protein